MQSISLAGNKDGNINMARASKKGMVGSWHLYSLLKKWGNYWTCITKLWVCNRGLEMHNSLWARLGNTRKTELCTITLAAICWNIWREIHSRIFKDTAHSTYSCFLHIIHDVCHWTALLSNEERLHLSHDGIDGNGDSEGEESGKMTTRGVTGHTWW